MMHATVYTTPQKFMNFINDVDSYVNWVYKCEASEVLERINHEEMIYYSRSDLPWPISNRDIVMYSVTKQDPRTGGVHIHSTAIPDHIPLKDDVVRVEEVISDWVITPSSDGQSIFIEYNLVSDPGGSIPTWLINMAIDKGPKDTIETIKEKLE